MQRSEEVIEWVMVDGVRYELGGIINGSQVTNIELEEYMYSNKDYCYISVHLGHKDKIEIKTYTYTAYIRDDG